MKRTQLIEWGIITIGLIFGYKLFEGIFSALLALFYDFSPDRSNDLVKLTIYFLTYAVSLILLIRKSSLIAKWLNGTSENDNIPVKISKRSLLQIILLGICIATILSNIGYILLYLFEIFKNEVGRSHDPGNNMVSKYRFTISALESIIAFVVLYYSKDISGWIIQKNEADELTFESDLENKQ